MLPRSFEQYRQCCNSRLDLEHLPSCPTQVRLDCSRHVPPIGWRECRLCEDEGTTCRWHPCETCGQPVERVQTRFWPVKRYQHGAGEARSHIAEPATGAAFDAQGERL